MNKKTKHIANILKGLSSIVLTYLVWSDTQSIALTIVVGLYMISTEVNNYIVKCHQDRLSSLESCIDSFWKIILKR